MSVAKSTHVKALEDYTLGELTPEILEGEIKRMEAQVIDASKRLQKCVALSKSLFGGKDTLPEPAATGPAPGTNGVSHADPIRPDYSELVAKDAIAEALREHGPLTARELATVTGKTVGAISNALSTNWHFVGVGNARWDLRRRKQKQ